MLSPIECIKLRGDSGTTKSVKFDSESNPESYYKYAIKDLEESTDERSRINSLSNAKRALHFQVELLADAFGFKRRIKSNRSSFPQLLEFCSKCGIIAPRILKKLNHIRNLVEHEYLVPSIEEVEDFIDVVQLFLSSTDRFLRKFPTSLELVSEDYDLPDDTHRLRLLLRLEPSTGIIKIREKKCNKESDILHKTAKIEFEKVQSEIEDRKQLQKTFEFGEELKGYVYCKAITKLSEVIKFEFTAEQNEYFEWVSLLLKKY